MIAGANFDRSPVSTDAPRSVVLNGNVFNASSLNIVNTLGGVIRDVSVTGNSFANGSNTNFSGNLGRVSVGDNTFTASSFTINGVALGDVSVSGNSFSNGSATFSGKVGELTMSGNFSGDGNPVNFNFNGLSLSKTSTWNPQTGIHLINSGITVFPGVTLNLGAGLVIQNASVVENQFPNFTIEGDLRGPSTGSPAILTAMADASVYGGIDSANNYGWAGVSYAAGLTANLTNITIKHAQNGVLGSPNTISNGTFDRCEQAISVYGNSTAPTIPLAITSNIFLSSTVTTNASTIIIVSGNTFSSSNLSIYGNGVGRDVSVTGNSFSSGSATFNGNIGVLTISGNVSGDGNPVTFNLLNLYLSKTNTWNSQSNIHLINSGITVLTGATLNLGAGLVIQNASIQSNQYPRYDQLPNFTLQGDIRGPSTGSSAILTALGDDSVYGGTDNSSIYSWGGIYYAPGLTSNLANITIKHALIGVRGLPSIISNATFDRCNQAVMVDTDTTVGANATRTLPLTLSSNIFLSSPVYTSSSIAINVNGNTFNGSSLQVNGSGPARDVSLMGNTFINGGVNFSESSIAQFTGNLGLLSMSGNVSGDGNPVNFDLDFLTISKSNTWNPQVGVHLVSGIITIAAGAILNLGSGLVIQNRGANVPNGLSIQGDLRGPTTGSPAILTTISDNSPYGGTDSGGIWGGVYYAAGLTANLSNITIKHASVGLTADTANLNNDTFYQNNIGVVLNKGGGVYRNCSFTGNGTAVQNNSTVDVDAQDNWWGDLTGPYNAMNNPTGKGDPVSNHVIFSNWLLSNIAAQIGEKSDTSIDQRFVDCYNRVGAAIVGSVYNNSLVTAITGSTGTGLAQEFISGAGARNTILAKDGAANAYDVSGNTWTWYAAQNFAKGTAGFPTGDIQQEPVGTGTPGFDTPGTVQTFDGGLVFDSSYGTHLVPQTIISGLESTSLVKITNGIFGFPTSDLMSAPSSPQGTMGSLLNFEHAAIYSSTKYGIHDVYGPIYQQYITAGSSGGKLGFPTSDPYSYSGVIRQDFEGGSLVYGIITPTQIVLKSATMTGSPNQTVTLTATLSTSSGVKLNGKTITYSVDGVLVGTAVTNTSGVASRNYTIPASLTPGNHTVTAAFAGDSGYGAASVNGTLTLPKIATALTTLTVTGVQGQTVTLSATLKKSSGALISGETVSFKVDGLVVATGVTAANGVATYSFAVPATATQGTHTLAASFVGDSSYLASTASGTLNVLTATTVTVPTITGIHGKSVTLIGILTKSSDGTGIASKVLNFQVDGKSVGTATTGSTGKASLNYIIPSTMTLGSHVVTVTLPTGTINNGASGTGTLTVL